MQTILTSKNTIGLPLFVTQQNKLLIGALAFIIGAILYLASNHVVFFQPHYLSLTAFDKAMPFVPATIWIYLTEYFLFVSAYLSCKDLTEINKYIYAMMALQIFSVIIFLLWPTIYPRVDFPLPNNPHSLTIQIFNLLRSVDHPTSCFPSLHISSCYLSALIFFKKQKKHFYFFSAWATAIGLSTLTTKQHYIVDVIAGLVLACVFYGLFYRVIHYKARL